MLLQALVAVTTVLNSLVAGFLFAFAVVVMPGIRALDDARFLRAFQVIDGVVQRSQPLFLIVWGGSVVTMLASAAVGLFELRGLDLALVLVALVLAGAVQVITARINIPLNNSLQTLETAAMTPADLREARDGFESRWNRWNATRMVFAVGATTALVVLLLQL